MKILTAAALLLALALPASALGLTLDRCVGSALDNNEVVSAAEKKAAEARLEVREKNAAFLPTIGLSASYTRLPYASPSKAAVLKGSLDDYTFSVALKQPLYHGGRIRGEAGIAGLKLQKAENELARVRSELALDVASAYYAALHAERSLTAKRGSRSHLEAYFEKARGLSRRTLLPRPEDLLQIEVQLGNARIEEEAAGTAHGRALRRLLDLSRIDDEAAEIKGELPLPEAMPETKEDPLLGNYRYRSALLDMAAAERGVDVSRSALLPVLNLNAFTGWEWAQFPPSDDHTQWGISMEMLFFDFMRTHSRVRQVEMAFEQGLENLKLLERALRLEIKDRKEAIGSAKARFVMAEENIKKAERSLGLFRARTQSFTVNSRQLLDAEQASLQAELIRLNALFDYNMNRIELARLLGRERP